MMTDIVERLRSGEDGLEYAAANEIERLRAGLMRAMQYDNKCDQTGNACREPSKCGCYLEAEAWCDD
jgi:hypothetical protein